jgi:hypothetical protein
MHACSLAKVPSFSFCVLEFFGEPGSLFDEWQQLGCKQRSRASSASRPTDTYRTLMFDFALKSTRTPVKISE